MEIQLTKCHGSGNDFLLIDEMTHGYTFTEEERRDLSLLLCDRDSEFGADGILFVGSSDKADAKMRVFNSDGSEASMCGNGLRCVGRYVCELLNKDEIIVETMKADLKVNQEQEIYEGLPTYKVEISPVLFDVDSLPMNIDQETLQNEIVPSISDTLSFTALAVPNPHLISIVTPDQLALQEEMAKKLNGPNEICPDGVNVSFVCPIKEGEIYVRTFERGVGFTNACGTAMSASTLTTCLLGLNQMEAVIDVYNPGGKVRCAAHKKADGSYFIDLIGNATYLYHAKLDVELSNSNVKILSKADLEEQANYEKLEVHAKEYLDSTLFA
ncbi:diaminopimelate epimerase [Bacillus ectoiniformans]|uniref:diaminopimelate epimerase n=1 Tax=Bacillus ectoiniformans TaxID=1494429 RepID=UPI00195D1CE6|nr:diaminopimelate epimerase [Bacillus ectoiniformans]